MDNGGKKKIVTVWGKGQDYSVLGEILAGSYQVLSLTDRKEVCEILSGQSAEIAAVVADIGILSENGFEIVKKIREDMRFVAIPLAAVSPDPGYPLMKDAVKEGISEYFVPPFEEISINLRLNNAIRSKDSATMKQS